MRPPPPPNKHSREHLAGNNTPRDYPPALPGSVGLLFLKMCGMAVTLFSREEVLLDRRSGTPALVRSHFPCPSKEKSHDGPNDEDVTAVQPGWQASAGRRGISISFGPAQMDLGPGAHRAQFGTHRVQVLGLWWLAALSSARLPALRLRCVFRHPSYGSPESTLIFILIASAGRGVQGPSCSRSSRLCTCLLWRQAADVR